MNLSFLKKVVVKGEVKQSTRSNELHKPADGADLRVRYNGDVYPSEDFAKKFNLEYQQKQPVTTKGADGADITRFEYGENPGNGLDVFRSSDFVGITSEQPFIVIAATARTEGKIDLFKGCEYDENGKPKQSVLTQGSSSFGKNELLEMLKELYGIELNKETNPFVDLKVIGGGDTLDMPWRNTNGSSVYYLPKRYSRGENKGKVTTVRRECCYLWALVPAEAVKEMGTIELAGPTYDASAPRSEEPMVQETDLTMAGSPEEMFTPAD